MSEETKEVAATTTTPTSVERVLESVAHPKTPPPTPIQRLEARVRLLQIENDELRDRIAELENPPKAQAKIQSKTASPAPNSAPIMPAFNYMTQRQLVEFATDHGIDISKCTRANEIVDTIKQGWRLGILKKKTMAQALKDESLGDSEEVPQIEGVQI